MGDAAVALATPSTTSTTTLDILVKGSNALTMKAVSLLVGNAARMGLIKYARPSQVTGPTCTAQSSGTSRSVFFMLESNNHARLRCYCSQNGEEPA
jgi:hypothetical protein